MNAATFKTTENGYMTKWQVKACKTSKQIRMQLLQAGTDEKPSSKTISQVLLIFFNSNYAVKVRQRELRAGGNKLSAARGLRRII
jgi:hypothetical protein